MLLLVAVDTYEYENSFSDKLHQQVATYSSIDSAEPERFVRARRARTRVYANSGSFIRCAALAVPGVWCVVGSFYPAQCPS